MTCPEFGSVSSDISFSPATSDHESVLLAWRNNPNVRHYSQSTKIINETSHSSWFSARLTRMTLEPIFIFSIQQMNIGMVRLDKIQSEPNVFEISIIVDEFYQNRGYAKFMILQILRFATKELSAFQFVAYIHHANSHSKRLFTKVGFVNVPSDSNKFQKFIFKGDLAPLSTHV
jgi:RimJ/RimL family protein N-acetyltransferase